MAPQAGPLTPPPTRSGPGAIWTCPASLLASVLQRSGARRLLSIGSGEEEALPAPFDREAIERLHLRFNDIAAARAGLTAPSGRDVERLLAFAEATPEEALVIHCYAGVSRSPAAAYIVQCCRNAPGEEMKIARQLRRSVPEATPNPLLVAHADRLLGRDGRMIAAIAAIGRGSDAFEGAVMRW